MIHDVCYSLLWLRLQSWIGIYSYYFKGMEQKLLLMVNIFGGLGLYVQSLEESKDILATALVGGRCEIAVVV